MSTGLGRVSFVVPLVFTGANRAGVVGGIKNSPRIGGRLRGLNFITNKRIAIVSSLNKGIVIGMGRAQITVDRRVTHGVVV